MDSAKHKIESHKNSPTDANILFTPEELDYLNELIRKDQREVLAEDSTRDSHFFGLIKKKNAL